MLFARAYGSSSGNVLGVGSASGIGHVKSVEREAKRRVLAPIGRGKDDPFIGRNLIASEKVTTVQLRRTFLRHWCEGKVHGIGATLRRRGLPEWAWDFYPCGIGAQIDGVAGINIEDV